MIPRLDRAPWIAENRTRREVVTSGALDVQDFRSWVLAEARRILPHEWVLGEEKQLFFSWLSSDHQRRIALGVRAHPSGLVVEVRPSVVFRSVEDARVALRRCSGRRAAVVDDGAGTLRADVCRELGPLATLVEVRGAPFDLRRLLSCAVSWCAAFETVAQVRAVLEDDALFRAWCGRARSPEDLETLAAMHLAQGAGVLTERILAAALRTALGPEHY